LTTTGDLLLANPYEHDTTINRQQAPFSGTVARNKQSKSNLVSLLMNIFCFVFSFASLNYDHPQKKKINLI
jgi:hypothetical protein